MDLIRLNEGTIALYCISFNAFSSLESLNSLMDGLSADERNRVSHFLFEANKKEYLLSHYFLRRILGLYLAKSPLDLHFTRNELGKPVLSENELPNGGQVQFNLSHCKSHAAIAVSNDIPVGVDAESFDRSVQDLDGIAERFFSADEKAFIFTSAGEERRKAFFKCWTMKEAYLKALGHGITVPLSGFSVPVLDPTLHLDDYAFWMLEDENAQFCVSYQQGNRPACHIDARFVHSLEL